MKFKINISLLTEIGYIILVGYLMGYMKNSTLLKITKYGVTLSLVFSMVLMAISCVFWIMMLRDYKMRQKVSHMENTQNKLVVGVKMALEATLIYALLLPQHQPLNLQMVAYTLIGKIAIQGLFMALNHRLRSKIRN